MDGDFLFLVLGFGGQSLFSIFCTLFFFLFTVGLRKLRNRPGLRGRPLEEATGGFFTLLTGVLPSEQKLGEGEDASKPNCTIPDPECSPAELPTVTKVQNS